MVAVLVALLGLYEQRRALRHGGRDRERRVLSSAATASATARDQMSFGTTSENETTEDDRAVPRARPEQTETSRPSRRRNQETGSDVVT